MIDLETENLLSLHDVPKILPPRPNGKRVHISAIYRWAQRGIRGQRLEVIRVGGTTYTSREALQRFGCSSERPQTSISQTTRAQQRRVDDASYRVEQILGIRKNS